MKPHLGFIVMALVWSVPLASYAIWYVRGAERQARRRLRIAFDQINRDTRSSTVTHVSREVLANASEGASDGHEPHGRKAHVTHS
jgi:hypothetical protein